MVDLEVVVPDSLMKRLEEHAERIGRTVPELVSIWLWDFEEQQRASVIKQRDAERTSRWIDTANGNTAEGT